MKLFTRKNRPFSMVLGIVLISMLLAACGSSAGSGVGSSSSSSSGSGSSSSASGANGKGCKKVGILLPETASSARWDGVDRPDLEQGLQAAGFQFDYANAQGSASTQLTQAEQDLTKGDCILILAPNDSAAAAPIVTKAKAQGVPVISYDRLTQTKDLNYYVSFDNQKVGQLQGQYIVDHYKDYLKNGKGNTVMINGAQTDNNALLFNKGAHSALDPLFSNGTLKKVYETYTPNWDNATAQTEMEAALTANQNNVQIAYVANDGMANNVIAALKAAKLNGKVIVTGQDATTAGIHNILAGDQSMTVYKAITKEANAAIDLVKAISAGTDTSSLTNGATTATSDGGSIPSVLEVPVAVDKSNIASTVIADGFVKKADVCTGIPAGTDGVC
jgi:D-xylose transport system substrate-binding protein